MPLVRGYPLVRVGRQLVRELCSDAASIGIRWPVGKFLSSRVSQLCLTVTQRLPIIALSPFRYSAPSSISFTDARELHHQTFFLAYPDENYFYLTPCCFSLLMLPWATSMGPRNNQILWTYAAMLVLELLYSRDHRGTMTFLIQIIPVARQCPRHDRQMVSSDDKAEILTILELTSF